MWKTRERIVFLFGALQGFSDIYPVGPRKFVRVKAFPLSFLPTYLSITRPMNDSGATVFVANSHSFFNAALSWKPPLPSWSTLLDHGGVCHHWRMKCHAGILFIYFFPWPVRMHEFINCGCGTDGLPCFFSDDISIHGSPWKMSLWPMSVAHSPLMVNMWYSRCFQTAHKPFL